MFLGTSKPGASGYLFFIPNVSWNLEARGFWFSVYYFTSRIGFVHRLLYMLLDGAYQGRSNYSLDRWQKIPHP
jgi:hypothetical protein